MGHFSFAKAVHLLFGKEGQKVASWAEIWNWSLESFCTMNIQRQLTSAAIRAEAQRYEGVKVQLNKLFRLLELIGEPELRSSIKASLSIVRGMLLGLARGWNCQDSRKALLPRESVRWQLASSQAVNGKKVFIN